MILQSHKIWIQSATDQLVLEYQVLHSSLNDVGLGHFLHTQLYQIAGNISLTHLLVPGKLKPS